MGRSPAPVVRQAGQGRHRLLGGHRAVRPVLPGDLAVAGQPGRHAPGHLRVAQRLHRVDRGRRGLCAGGARVAGARDPRRDPRADEVRHHLLGAGRLWGEKIVLILSGNGKRGPRYLERVRAGGWRITWPLVVVAPFLPLPTTIIYVIAGVAGMHWVAFLVLDLIGELLWIGMLVGLGYALGHRAVVLAQEISHYSLWVTIGLVALVMGRQLWVSRRKS